jgi:molybdenum cofactor cytidylyltransferase
VRARSHGGTETEPGRYDETGNTGEPGLRRAVIPAAGRSRRMGRPKLLLPFGASTVLGSLVTALTEGGVDPVLLVLAPAERSDADAALHRFAREKRLETALNPEPERGMLSSIQTGVAALPPRFVDAPGATLLITPADLPALSPATVARLIEARETAGAPLAVPVIEPGVETEVGEQGRRRRGHPLAIAGALVPEIAELDPRVGLRQLLERHAAELLEVPVADPGAVRDVDAPEDLATLRRSVVSR